MPTASVDTLSSLYAMLTASIDALSSTGDAECYLLLLLRCTMMIQFSTYFLMFQMKLLNLYIHRNREQKSSVNPACLSEPTSPASPPVVFAGLR